MSSPQSDLLPLAPDKAVGPAGHQDSGGVEGRAATADYLVVARRYRPQSFEELVGQEHVARALTGAIASGRVGHAYLFTGARGVGKTSAARILAKALDCVHGPTATPCNQCDICESIASGNDVDVLEIDGASNRGIDEIRQLRQNVGIRPSRARFKIYIIDEVHMLTREAFNALLKTLEEPPEHVKFIFCTTEANKIPITILSRCQRFDFAGIRAPSIRERLRQIAEAEGVEAEPAALELLARRANGSMRDSQSLLEQLLAFGGKAIMAADVHSLLGTAGDARLARLLSHLVARDAAAALGDLDAALIEGVDVGQLLEQLLSILRDAMAAAVGCPAESFLYTSVEEQGTVAEAGEKLGLETILAILQILDHTLSRMRYSTQGRTLAETALVRICNLEHLDGLAQLLGQLQTGGEISAPASSAGARPRATAPTSAAPATVNSAALGSGEGAKKKDELSPAPHPPENGAPSHDAVSASRFHAEPSKADSAPPEPAAPAVPQSVLRPDLPHSQGANASPEGGLSAEPLASSPTVQAETNIPGAQDPLGPHNVRQVWEKALNNLPAGMLAESASCSCHIATSAPNRLVVHFSKQYNFNKSFCERPEQLDELRRAVSQVTGTPVHIEFVVTQAESSAAATPVATPRPAAAPSQRQWLAEKGSDPYVQHVSEVFGAPPYRAEPPSG